MEQETDHRSRSGSADKKYDATAEDGGPSITAGERPGVPIRKKHRHQGICRLEEEMHDEWLMHRQKEGVRGMKGPATTEYHKIRMVYNFCPIHNFLIDAQYRMLVKDLPLRYIQFIKALVRDKPKHKAAAMLYVSPEFKSERAGKEATRAWGYPGVRDLYDYLNNLDVQYANENEALTPEDIILKLESIFRRCESPSDAVKLSELIIKYRKFNMTTIEEEQGDPSPITEEEQAMLSKTMSALGLKSTVLVGDQRKEATHDQIYGHGNPDGAGLPGHAGEKPGAAIYSPIPIPEDGEELGED